MSMWDERYGGGEWIYGSEPNDFLREQAARIRPGGRVLSLGEGEGRNGLYLASRGHRVTAVDSSRVGLASLARHAAERGVEVEAIFADLAEWTPPEGAFDAVISIFCHLPETVRARIHRAAVRALAPSGVFILEAYTPAQLAHGTGGPRDLALLYSLSTLREDLAGLELEIGREVEREVHEGPLHTGLAATVQIVAAKPPRA